ncbi:MAG TPA: bifunctional DNA-formamidopyrimidine glycosylase/DNA-(apurinic or apyrimidinic site) lyase [Smithella sp.]|nr:bifunctional DNA-formamidopyrimidine glycosylase/DNA-(apurinic or apyrimidinic site) lyase [Smithella sp.]
MPELPEVETLCRQLRKKICHRKICACRIDDAKIPKMKNVVGREIIGVERVGKTIWIGLEDDTFIKIHLRMSGRLLWKREGPKPKYVRWTLKFSDGAILLVDPRRFATVDIQRTKQDVPNNDFVAGFDEERFFNKQAKRKVHIKTLLMDPKALAGIGNIYACEILHRSKLSPFRQANTLTLFQWRELFKNARAILNRGIEKRGTSISDWRDLYGRRGRYQHELKVYGREGVSCQTCGETIIRVRQGGRSTYCCPCCQKS